MNTKDIFSGIYKENTWGSKGSVSGPGSTLDQTNLIRERLPVIFEEHNIKSILDIPCGDFHWMQHVYLENIMYTGADIVTEIIFSNKKYEKDNIKFINLDIIKDDLREVDIIFSRDCLVHFSYDDIYLCLSNICYSGAQFFITTTFCERTSNLDIATGQWRPLNLQIPPFSLPEPLMIINEECPTEEWRDKSMALWKVADIKTSLDRQNRLESKQAKS
jgi:hypothetical protein